MTITNSELTGFISGFYNVELHHHLDGSIRVQTIRDVAEKHKIPFDYKKFKDDLDNCGNLVQFLAIFAQFLPIFQGRRDALERFAYECVEDHYNNEVAYFETRFAPFLLVGESSNEGGNETSDGDMSNNDNDCTSVNDVMDAVLAGLARGVEDFGVKCGLIICSLRGMTDLIEPSTKLLYQYQNHPLVVGIDVAGDENHPWTERETELTKTFFQDAHSLGYGCTFHAGEQGMSENIKLALDDMKTTRVGHGYALFKDESLLQRCKSERVHFEYCPISANTLNSLGTKFDDPNNPILLGKEQGINFSLNCDDALFFGDIKPSIKLCQDVLKFTDDDLFQIRINAAQASFLPDDRKAQLVEHIQQKK